MVRSPSDEIDREDFDDIAEYIAACNEIGFTIEASDFEGRPCTRCGVLLDFAEWMQNPNSVVMWDVRVQDPDQSEPEPYFARYYYCSEECKREDKEAVINGEEMHPYGEEDRIHEDDMEGLV